MLLPLPPCVAKIVRRTVVAAVAVAAVAAVAVARIVVAETDAGIAAAVDTGTRLGRTLA